MTTYCVRCKSRTGNKNERSEADSRGRKRIKSECTVCGTVKYRYVAMKGEGVDVHRLIEKLPSPKKGWVLPGYKYCGPMNPLDEQISSDGTVLDKPKNILDEICLSHDLDYNIAKSQKDKHDADRKMLDS